MSSEPEIAVIGKRSRSDLDEWKALSALAKRADTLDLNGLFKNDPERFKTLSVHVDGMLFDYSKNLVNSETMKALYDLARACDLKIRRDEMFSGAPINNTENRTVLHAAMRGSVADSVQCESENGSETVNAFRDHSLLLIEQISDKVRADQVFTDVVNIGIGGSDLGPKMVCEALKHHADGPRLHFVSNVDRWQLDTVLAYLNPETTMFIVASKTFTTLETLTNAQSAKTWLVDSLGPKSVANHFIGISTNIDGAQDFGIDKDKILPMRDWIGGRYSLWSTIGLSIAVAVGFEGFQALLKGAHDMDEHFKSAPLEQNIPVIAGLLGVWYRNFLDMNTYAILPYSEALHRLPAYIQQVDMESNGKRVSRDGEALDYDTGPIIFGEPGTNAQHAFFQLMHQGTDIIPCDFIAAKYSPHSPHDHHKKLLANALAQAQALMEGQDSENKHRHFEGGRPSTMIVLDTLDPYHLGLLLAFYEHKVFVQGVIWDINSFDQWGVELGKKLAKNIMGAFESEPNQTVNSDDLDSSTRGLLRYINDQSS